MPWIFIGEVDSWKIDGTLIGLAVMGILCVVLQRYRSRHVKKLIREWGDVNGFAFTSMKEAGLKRGPFKFSANSKNIVMEVTATRQDQSVVHGWIQCRYSLTKLDEYTITARWDGDETVVEDTLIDADDVLRRAGIER